MAIIVNGDRIEDGAIAQEIERLQRQRGQQQAPSGDLERLALQEQAENGLIERVLVRQAARARKDPIADEEIDAEMERTFNEFGGKDKFLERFDLTEADMPRVREDTTERLKMKRLFAEIDASVEQVAEEDARAWYEAHQQEFTAPSRAHVIHIVKHVKDGADEEKAKEAIENAQQELRAGREFSEVAKEFSDCPNNGGDLGWFPRGQMVESFDQVVFEQLQPGEVSGTFRTEFGWHIARLVDRQESGATPFGEVKADVIQRLRTDRRNEAFQAFSKKLRDEAEIRREA